MWKRRLLVVLSCYAFQTVQSFPHPSDPSAVNSFKCPGVGLVSEPNNCSAYHHCLIEGQSPVGTHQCPPNALFDSLEKNCRPKKTANCITCKEDGFFKDNSNPSNYIECHGGIAERIPCEPGFTFNLEYQACETEVMTPVSVPQSFLGGSPLGDKLHPQLGSFIPSNRTRFTFTKMEELPLAVAVQAKAGPAISSASSRNGFVAGAHAHSEASIAGEKTSDEAPQGSGTNGEADFRVHAMATAAGGGASSSDAEGEEGRTAKEANARARRRADPKFDPRSNAEERAREKRRKYNFGKASGSRSLSNPQAHSRKRPPVGTPVNNFGANSRSLSYGVKVPPAKRPPVAPAISRNRVNSRGHRSLPLAPQSAPFVDSGGQGDRRASKGQALPEIKTLPAIKKIPEEEVKPAAGPVDPSGTPPGGAPNPTSIKGRGIKINQTGRAASPAEAEGRKADKGAGTQPDRPPPPPAPPAAEPPPPPPPAPPAAEPPPPVTEKPKEIPAKPTRKRYIIWKKKTIRVPCKPKGGSDSAKNGQMKGRGLSLIKRNETNSPDANATKVQPLKAGRGVFGFKKRIQYPTESPSNAVAETFNDSKSAASQNVKADLKVAPKNTFEGKAATSNSDVKLTTNNAVEGKSDAHKDEKIMYKISKSGAGKGRWASAATAVGTSSITGTKGGSIAGANAQMADPNSRTKADATAAVWGDKAGFSRASADSKNLSPSTTLCLNPPCETGDTEALAAAGFARPLEGTEKGGSFVEQQSASQKVFKANQAGTKTTATKDQQASAIKIDAGLNSRKESNSNIDGVSSKQLNKNNGKEEEDLSAGRVSSNGEITAEQDAERSGRKNPGSSGRIRPPKSKRPKKGRQTEDSDEEETDNTDAVTGRRASSKRTKSGSSRKSGRKGGTSKTSSTGTTKSEEEEDAESYEETAVRTSGRRKGSSSSKAKKSKRRQKVEAAASEETEAEEEEAVESESGKRRKDSKRKGTRSSRRSKKGRKTQSDGAETDDADEEETKTQAKYSSSQAVEENSSKQRRRNRKSGKQSESDQSEGSGSGRRSKSKKKKTEVIKKDLFAFEFDGMSSTSIKKESSDLGSFEHSMANVAQNFGRKQEWKTGQESAESDHSASPVSYTKTFGSTNTTAYKKSQNENKNGNVSFSAGKSEKVAKQHQYATDERLGARKHMSKQQEKKVESTAGAHTGEDGTNRAYEDSHLTHYEKTNISEIDHHTGDQYDTQHEKELKHSTISEMANFTDGNQRVDTVEKKKGFERKNTSYLAEDVEQRESIDKAFAAERNLAAEKNATSERVSETDKTVRAESIARFTNESGEEVHMAKSSSLSADSQSHVAKDGKEERGFATNSTYATDTESLLKISEDLEEASSHQKVRGSEATRVFAISNGTKTMADVSSLIGSDTSSASNKTDDKEFLSNLQTSISKHADSNGKEEDLGNNVTQAKFETNEEKEISQTAVLIERSNTASGEPESEKISQSNKFRTSWGKAVSDVYNDTNNNFSSSATALSGNTSDSVSGSEKFNILSEEGKQKEQHARVGLRHKKGEGNSGSETDSTEDEEEEEEEEGERGTHAVKAGSGKATKKKKGAHSSGLKESFYSDEGADGEGGNGKNGSGSEGFAVHASASAGLGEVSGDPPVVVGSRTKGRVSESGAMAGAGNGVAKAVVSLKSYPKREESAEDDGEDAK